MKIFRLRFAALLAALFVASLPWPGPIATTAHAAELIMLEEDGCPWCKRWNKEIGVVYHKTGEGRRAPLRRINIHAPLPSDLKFLVKGRYTPTFVLIEEKREIGRIRGYPGEGFFWGLLNQMLKKLPPRKQAARTTN